ncbi:S1C family serine protease [Flavihumibacter petaseus]|uniref:Peptidase S1 family protein n=1 Tax=Flavihumibacter petaseus NBRC 106054 TaxID=1220578 RepID=A0A0E9MWC1_9BACT|nr:trypsin-like peptidase domain-containing protein [Flavihumibacter petaseus]GAO41400.1 peptidase S1 family protein [Flavihumibacter petaseus NBRC 106054]
MRTSKPALCFAILALSFSASFSQTVKVSANPSNAKLALNSSSTSDYVKVKARQTNTGVLAYLDGYITSGLMATELDGKNVSEYTIKLNKVNKLPKDFNSRKIEFTKLKISDDKEAITPLVTMVKTTMSSAGYKMVGTNSLFNNKSDAPDLAVGGEILWVSTETAGRGFQASILVHWSVYSMAKETVVYEVTTGGFSDSRKRGTVVDEMTQAVKDAINGLIYDAKFQDLAIKKSEAVAATPKDAIVVGKVPVKKYDNYSALIKESLGSVVTVKTNFGIGSGFIVSTDGYILTNDHVINSAEKIEVIFDNGFSFEAKLVRTNESKDVAVIKISGNGFKPLPINPATELATTGSEVFAIGTPENIKLGQTVTKGIISGKREIEEKVFLQTDVAINSGNSGGPLINSSTGEVIGIVAAKIKAKGVEGLGFAIPMADALKALNITFE